MDAEFEKWFQSYEMPRIQNSPISNLIMRHIDDVKAEAKTVWENAWKCARANPNES